MRALESSEKKTVDTVRQLFDEIDVKGHGWIDKFHFRLLLRSLRLTFSNDRFDRLYRAVDSSGDGKLEWEELHELLFGHLDEQQPQARANLPTRKRRSEPKATIPIHRNRP
jgi:Ca2+-binding EF-hand superfamily protein